MLTGEQNLIKAARGVLELGPDLVVLKKGEHGALVVAPDLLFAAPAYPVESVVDPTGAGDTFAGGFVGHLSTSSNPLDPGAVRKATIYGTVLASFTVESFGLERLAAASKEEIDTRYRGVETLTRF